MSKLVVQVTDKHIRNGTLQESTQCAVALALLDAGFSYVEVDDSRLELTRGEKYCTVPAPPDVTNFIREYDAGRNVVPFHFDLELPEECG